MNYSLSQRQLYTFVDWGYLRGRDSQELARQLCAGGADIIQLRAKGLTPEEILPHAEGIARITESAGVLLVVNDHPQVAAAVGASLCHLGQEDFFDAGYASCEEVHPSSPQLRFGLSTHSPMQAERAVLANPAYIAIGPVFATPTKPTATPVTLDYVRWADAHVSIPWFAIGGISLSNLDQVLEAGARRICVVSAILGAEDVAGACQQFKERLRSSPV